MEFKRCARCGCFYTSNDSVCQNCLPKDKKEINQLKNFIEYNNEIDSINSLSINTGISEKNLQRYLTDSEYKDIHNNFNITL